MSFSPISSLVTTITSWATIRAQSQWCLFRSRIMWQLMDHRQKAPPLPIRTSTRTVSWFEFITKRSNGHTDVEITPRHGKDDWMVRKNLFSLPGLFENQFPLWMPLFSLLSVTLFPLFSRFFSFSDSKQEAPKKHCAS